MVPVIRFENVSKRFKLYHQKHYSLKENVLTMFRDRGRWEEFWALKAVDLEVPAGQMLGIIGENGSGKSTCLKLLARILVPDTGTVTVNGSVSALIELGAGFQPDFTGRENVYLNGSILGFTRRQIDERFDDIVKFAELERFIDTPVKTYSSGMYMRLGFSIATHVDPDILLIDEILAVGDEPFQAKCLDRIQSYRAAGKTIVFVSHALGAVESLCDRVILLSKGRVVADGAPRDTIECYRRVLGIAAHTQVLVPGPAAPARPERSPADAEAGQRIAELTERIDRLEATTSTACGEEKIRDLAARCEELGARLNEELASRRSVEGALNETRLAEIENKAAILERRISGPMSIENAQERIVQLEHCMSVVQSQDCTRDRALGDLSARIDQLEDRLSTFFREGLAVVPRQYGTRDIEVTEVSFHDAKGEATTRFKSGEQATIRVRYRTNRAVPSPVVGFSFTDQRGATIFGTNTQIDGAALSLGKQGCVEISIPRLALLSGLFHVGVAVHSADHSVQYHRLDNYFQIVVEPRRNYEGHVDMECQWRVRHNTERGAR